MLWNDQLGYCMEKGLWEAENGSHELSVALAGDPGGLNQGSWGKEAEFDRYLGSQNSKTW